jgi:hypothetical protein
MGVSRRSVLWLVTLSLAVVGSQLGHALAYHLVTPNGPQHAVAATGHAYLAYAPVVFAVCGVLVVLALARELAAAFRDGRLLRPSALPFTFLAPAIFVSQEHLERLLHDGAFPWETALEPTFLVGLVLQVPFAAAAYLLARLLLRVVRSLGRLLAGRPRSRMPASAPARPGFSFSISRLPALALGYGSRGPPIPSP